MSIHFEKLQVGEVRIETADCVSITFLVPGELKNKFHYIQGQYLTLRIKINGEDIRRSYSICSSPLDAELRIAIKKMPGGIFSTFAIKNIRKGDLIDVMPPMGKFYTALDPANSKEYVGIASGSGITPLLSIIKTTLRTELRSSFTLVYGNRNRQSILFRNDLEALKNLYMHRFRVIYLLSREKTDSNINFGRIDSEKCKVLFDKYIIPHRAATFFICGPDTMIFTVKGFLEKIGIDQKKIRFELFSTVGLGKKKLTDIQQQSIVKNNQHSKITVKTDGVSIDFDLSFEGEAILDAAIKQGADLPYACKGGVCCTCRAKLLEGEVDMDANYGLEPEEIERGFILTCQSHPRTEKVVIDFDIK